MTFTFRTTNRLVKEISIFLSFERKESKMVDDKISQKFHTFHTFLQY